MDDIDITITLAAQQHLLAIINKQPEKNAVRLHIKNSGCSGLSYVVGFSTAEYDDYTIEQGGVTLLIAKQDYPMLRGLTIDYKLQGLNGLLRFDNPNAVNTCGCGESFQLKDTFDAKQ